MPDDEIMANASRIRVSQSANEVSITFILPTVEEATLTYSAIQARMELPERQLFTIRLGPKRRGVKLLGKIIPLLGSNQAGEVAAAAAACERVLRQGGRDWHWLAGIASGSATASSINASYLEAEVRNLKSRLAGQQKINERIALEVRNLSSENARLRGLNASLQARIDGTSRWSQREAPRAGDKPVDRRGSRLRTRAGMMLDDPDCYLPHEDRVFVAAVRTWSGRPGFVLGGDPLDRFEGLWRRYRRGE